MKAADDWMLVSLTVSGMPEHEEASTGRASAEAQQSTHDVGGSQPLLHSSSNSTAPTDHAPCDISSNPSASCQGPVTEQELQRSLKAWRDPANTRGVELLQHVRNLLNAPATVLFFEFTGELCMKEKTWYEELGGPYGFDKFAESLTWRKNRSPSLHEKISAAAAAVAQQFGLREGFWSEAPDAMQLVREDSDHSLWGLATGSHSASGSCEVGTRPSFAESAAKVLEILASSSSSSSDVPIPGRGFLEALAQYTKDHSDDAEYYVKKLQDERAEWKEAARKKRAAAASSSAQSEPRQCDLNT